MKPYSESSEQNKLPILEVLKQEISRAKTLLEIGSGTGQHAVFFAEQFPHISWQTSDRESYHAGINAWIGDCAIPNVLAPITLDVSQNQWPQIRYDAVFSANTAHIMSDSEVHQMLKGVAKVLKNGGRFCLYGPFNYNGQYTSDSNASFDQWLKQRDPNSGIKDISSLAQWANNTGLSLIKDYEMPVNNRILVWEKRSEKQ